MRSIVTVIFIVLAVAANGQNYSEAPLKVNALEVIKKGVDLYDEEKYDEALKYFNQVHEGDTGYALALYEAALTHRSNKKPAEAVKLLKKGVTLRSEYKRSFYEMLGSSYDEAGDFKNAVKTYYDGLREFPTYDMFYNEIAVAFANQKNGDSALANFVKAVEMNPIRAVNHLKLSAFMLKNNKLVPAMMSFLLYGVFEANQQRLLNQLIIYEKVLKKEMEFSPDSVVPISYDFSQFDEVEQIVKSNMAVSSDYKIPIKLSFEYLLKNFHVMMEKIRVKKSSNDIWNTFYVPILRKIFEEKNFEPFMLQVLSGVEIESIQEQVKKNKKEIDKFTKDMVGGIYKKYMKNKTSIVEGKQVKAEHHYFPNGNIQAIADFNESTKSYVGYCYFFTKNGSLSAKGVFGSNGKKDGDWFYYSEDGSMNGKETYKSGVLNGEFINYYPNGNFKEKGNYVDGFVEGDVYFYRTGGALRKIRAFSKGKALGTETQYFDNDLLEQKTTVNEENRYNGPIESYYSNGNKYYIATYKNGEFDGKFRILYRNEQTLKEEGEFVDGKRVGKRIVYFEDGKSIMRVEDNYKNGKLTGSYTVYFKNGKISEQGTSEGDSFEGPYVLNDTNGRTYAKYEYKKGKVQKGTYTDASGKVIWQFTASKKYVYKSYYDDGALYEEGNVVDHARDGQWKQYYRNGNLRKEMTYAKEKFNGVVKDYYEHGALESEVNYTDGEMDGLYKEYYPNGTLRQQGWYENGQSTGSFYNYEEHGSIGSEIYLFQGERQGPMKMFDVTGRLNNIQYWDNGVLYKVESFDSTGNVVKTSENKAGTGKLSWYHINGKLKTETDYKNGYEHGTRKVYHANGKLVVETQYKNGMREGSYKTYNAYGKIVVDCNYSKDLLDSTYTLYDFDGYKISSMRYKYNNLNGRRQWFYPNGKVETEGSYRDDERHGTFKYWAPDGTLMISRDYMDGVFVSYTYLDASGKLVAPKPVDQKKQEVVAYYPNGKKSQQFSVVFGKIHGKMESFYPNGGKKEEYNWFYGDYEGVHKTYYENGQLEKDENFKNDELSGVCRYYHDNGKLKRVTTFVNGVRHGEETTYDKAGKKITSNFFYNGEIVQ